jgi:hypothetical protein
MSGVIYPINNKEYTAEDVEIFNCTRTSGVHSVLDFDLSLSGNVLTVGKGLAWIKNGDFSGKAIAFKDVTTITLDGADSTGDRYDIVAVRYDATKKEPEIVIIKGEASANPVIPIRSTESYLYELFLYSILRKAGESTASFGNVTDLRQDRDYCGIMEDSVTSAVSPVYETIHEGGRLLRVGDTIDFDYEKYEYLIATISLISSSVDSGNPVDCDVILTKNANTVSGSLNVFSGFSSFYTGTYGSPNVYVRAQIKLNKNSATNHLVSIVQFDNSFDFSDDDISSATISKLVGVTKQPKGYVAVDDMYNPESHNAQSGEAVKQAIDEALEGFEPPEQDSGSGVSEAQRQTLLAVINAIGLFNVPNAQELLDNFNNVWDVVEPVPATSITLDKTEITFTSEETQTLVATVLPSDTTDIVVWKSSNTSIATVVGGVVTPLSDGETTITAKAGNKSATCKVIVNLYGEIENPVFLNAGVLDKNSTATSEPFHSDTLPNSSTFSAVPVKKGDIITCKTNIDTPKTWLKWWIFDTDGNNAKNIYSSEAQGWDTATATQDGFIRVTLQGHATGNNGLTNTISEYSVTSGGVKTTYTVVDQR